MSGCDVALYGHLMIDRIVDGLEEHRSLGGIANVWHGLLKINKTLKVEINPAAIGEALILIDRENCDRIGRGEHNLEYTEPNVSIAKWHHIAYINALKNTQFINEIDTGVISADITKENPENVLPFLNKIDYLFIASEDVFMDINELASLVKGWLIIHSPDSSLYINGDHKKRVYRIPPKLILENANVLGAGDYFAAGFINRKLHDDIHNSILDAHEKASMLIRGNS